VPVALPEIAARRSRRRRAVAPALVAILVLGGLYVAAPRLLGGAQTWRRVGDGSPVWLAAAVAFEVMPFAGYVWLLRRVATRDARPLPWSAAWRITLAGVAATRIITVAGAGGIAITIAGLRRAGFSTREAAERQAIDLVALYACFFGAMVVDGTLLLLSGDHPALSLVPALLGVAVLALALLVARVPATFESTIARRFGHRAAAVAALPEVLALGVRGALGMARGRDRALCGAVAWWACDIAAFWACLHAFGGSIGVTALVMAYLAGHAFNVLPVPGGVGPVEGGMIAALVAFGEPAGLALVAVLGYQVISVWLPAAPGALALLGLRRPHAGDTHA
jgi:uncharacterized membrane protein YbhN (UPF0104 family)